MKKIISFICSVLVGVSAISSPLLLGKCDIVSALTSSESVVFPENSSISSTVDSTLYINAYNKLKENSNLPDDCYVLLNINGVNCEVFIISSDFDYEYSFLDGFWGGTTTVYFADCVQFFCNYDSLDDYSFSLGTYDFTSTTQFRLAHNSDLIFPWFAVNTQISNGNPVVINNNPNYRAFFNHTLPPFSPEFETVPLPFYSMDIDSFEDWIINNNKLSELPSYIIQSKLKSFLEFYKQFGSSNAFFISKIPLWFAHMNIANQSISNISALKSAIDKLYQEYINYRSGTHAYWPGAVKIQERDTIDTKTDNNDLTLVTDDSNDSLDISILRDILRGVIAISNNVNQGCANIVQKLDELNFVVNVVNDGGDSSPIDFSSLYTYDSDAFSDDLQTFEANVEEVQNIPQGYIDTINQNSLMPENMLSDKNSLTVNVPCITGFTISNNGSSYSTQTGTYMLSSSEYPWLDTVVQKIKRFASIILIIGYLVHLRYRIPELVRGE